MTNNESSIINKALAEYRQKPLVEESNGEQLPAIGEANLKVRKLILNRKIYSIRSVAFFSLSMPFIAGAVITSSVIALLSLPTLALVSLLILLSSGIASTALGVAMLALAIRSQSCIQQKAKEFRDCFGHEHIYDFANPKESNLVSALKIEDIYNQLYQDVKRSCCIEFRSKDGVTEIKHGYNEREISQRVDKLVRSSIKDIKRDECNNILLELCTSDSDKLRTDVNKEIEKLNENTQKYLLDKMHQGGRAISTSYVFQTVIENFGGTPMINNPGKHYISADVSGDSPNFQLAWISSVSTLQLPENKKYFSSPNPCCHYSFLLLEKHDAKKMKMKMRFEMPEIYQDPLCKLFRRLFGNYKNSCDID